MDEFFSINLEAIGQLGSNPFEIMLWIVANGGWVIFILLFLWMAEHVYLEWREHLYHAKRSFIVLSISVPRLHEQGPRAVDNMFAFWTGAQSGTNSWKETWIDGKSQELISVEIVSIEGRISFIVRTVKQLRDLIEAGVYAQYPDAEIVEIQDYSKNVPGKYEDPEWDLWGTEIVPIKSDVYSLRTYTDFEDKVSGEFKDPMSALLESFARLGQGEQVWIQLILLPILQADFQKKAAAEVKKLKGIKEVSHPGIIEQIVTFPFKLLVMIVEGILGTASAPAKAPEKKEGVSLQNLTEMEKSVIHAVENKAAKLVYLVKFRIILVGKREKLQRQKISSFLGSFKQLYANNGQALKPENKKTGINGTLIWFKDKRNTARKNRLISAYQHRDPSAGAQMFHMSTEELATIWHFPHTMQVKAPQVQKTEAKKTEPPINLPFG